MRACTRLAPAVCALALTTAPPVDDEVYGPAVLAHVLTGLPDPCADAEGEAERAVINVKIDGRIVALGTVLDDPDAKDGGTDEPSKLEEHLASVCTKLDESEDESYPILVRADLVAPFSRTLSVLAALPASGEPRVVHLAVSDARSPRLDAKVGLLPTDGPEQVLPLTLPRALEVPPEGVRSVALAIRVLAPGRKLEVDRESAVPWKGEPGTRFRFDLRTRAVEYRIGENAYADFLLFRQALQGMKAIVADNPLTLDLGPGVTNAEALRVFDSARSIGAKDVRLISG